MREMERFTVVLTVACCLVGGGGLLHAEEPAPVVADKRPSPKPRPRLGSAPEELKSLPPGFQWEIPPRIQTRHSPVYPIEALREGEEGSAIIRFVVGKSGRIIDLEQAAASAPEFGAAAMAAVETWVFTPAQQADGTPTMALLAERFEFHPTGSDSVDVPIAALQILGLLRTDPARIVGLRDLDAMPERIDTRQPVFPRALRGTGAGGVAMIEFYIDEKGKAQLPGVVSAPEPEFGFAAVQAVSTWRFSVPRLKHRPVVARVRIPIRFEPDTEQNPADNQAAPAGGDEG